MKMWYIYTTEYYSAIERNEIMPFAAIWMDLEIVTCCWKRVFAMISGFSWQNSVRLCPPSFCAPRSNLLVTTDIF